jgi:thiol-disulfide isomerase/thioredoxin
MLIWIGVSAQAQTRRQGADVLDLKDVYGRPVRLANYKGNVVLLNFWATWCPPCRTEIPDLIKLQRTYRREGLRIIGITYPPQTRSEVRGFAQKLRINYPIALGDKATKELFTKSETLPVTVVIDREGATLAVIEGIMYADEFDAKVKPLLVPRRRNTSATQSRVQNRASVQKARIEVNGEGYRPALVNLKRGVPAQLTFVRKVEETCGREIVIPAYGINRPLPLDTPVTVTFTPRRSGRFKFTCGMDMFRGSLLVE